MKSPPKMTYYARVRSNLTGQLLTNWKTYDSSIWYYGKCNALEGGESEYIVEIDIWNNEPAFNAGEWDAHNQSATSCRLTLSPLSNQDLSLFKLSSPFLYARCFTTNTREEWTGVKPNEPLRKIYGNVNSVQNGVLFGNADHAILQTKIILPPNSELEHHQRYPFNLKFSYNYE